MSNPIRPTLALCIPAYNAARYLPRILTSAKKQAIPFDEILVYNDCSTDDTAYIAKSYGAKVIDGTTNLGCTWGRKILAEHVTSNWIHFHDADDDMLENFTTLAHKWMTLDNPPDVVLFDYNWIELETEKLLGETRFNQSSAEKDAILFTIENQINPFCGLYNTKQFLAAGGPDTDPLVKYYEDAAMHCKLAKAGLKFSVESEVSIVNYCVTGSMSRNINAYSGYISSFYSTMKKNYEDLKAYPKFDEYKQAIGLKMWKHTRHAAWISEWDMLKKTIQLAKDCNVKIPKNESYLFRTLARFNEYYLIVFREFYNRLFRPKDKLWY